MEGLGGVRGCGNCCIVKLTLSNSGVLCRARPRPSNRNNHASRKGNVPALPGVSLPSLCGLFHGARVSRNSSAQRPALAPCKPSYV